jgi:hypothetical protein
MKKIITDFFENTSEKRRIFKTYDLFYLLIKNVKIGHFVIGIVSLVFSIYYYFNYQNFNFSIFGSVYWDVAIFFVLLYFFIIMYYFVFLFFISIIVNKSYYLLLLQGLIMLLLYMLGNNILEDIFGAFRNVMPESFEGNEVEFYNIMISSIALVVAVATSTLGFIFTSYQYRTDKRIQVMPILKVAFKKGDFRQFAFYNNTMQDTLNGSEPVICAWVQDSNNINQFRYENVFFQNISNNPILSLGIQSVKLKKDDAEYFDVTDNIRYETIEETPLATGDFIRIRLYNFPLDIKIDEIEEFPYQKNFIQVFQINLKVKDVLNNLYYMKYEFKLELNTTTDKKKVKKGNDEKEEIIITGSQKLKYIYSTIK